MNQARRFKAICFDYYKTLVVPKYPESEAVRRFLVDLKKKIESGEIVGTKDMDIEFVFGQSIGFFELMRRATNIDVPIDALIRTLTTRLGIYGEDSIRMVVDLYTEHLIRSVELPPDTLPVLKALRSMGLKLAVISNAHQVYFIKKGLRKFGLDVFFDEVVVSGDVGVRKPSQEIFFYTATKLGVRPEDCAMVGDNVVSDFIGSLHAGMYPILIAREEDDYKLYLGVIKRGHIVRKISEVIDIVT